MGAGLMGDKWYVSVSYTYQIVSESFYIGSQHVNSMNELGSCNDDQMQQWEKLHHTLNEWLSGFDYYFGCVMLWRYLQMKSLNASWSKMHLHHYRHTRQLIANYDGWSCIYTPVVVFLICNPWSQCHTLHQGTTTVGFRSNRHPSVTVTHLTEFWFRHLVWRAMMRAKIHQVWQLFEPYHQYI